MKKTGPSELKLSWLLTPDHDDVTLERDGPDLRRMPYAVPPDIGEAWIESLAFPASGLVHLRGPQLR